MSTQQRRVCFHFGDDLLEGDVVDEIPTPDIAEIDRTTLRVDVGGETYRVLDRDTIDV